MYKQNSVGFLLIHNTFQRDTPCIQELYKPLKENGAARTIQDLLENFIPESLSPGE